MQLLYTSELDSFDTFSYLVQENHVKNLDIADKNHGLQMQINSTNLIHKFIELDQEKGEYNNLNKSTTRET